MKKEDSKIRYDFVAVLVIFHLLALSGFYFFSWTWALISLFLLWPISHGIGLACTFHRKLTHNGFETPLWLEYVMTTCGTLAFQSSHFKWIAVHKLHHAATEKEADPHSPRFGFLWSHIGWMIKGDPTLDDPALHRKYAKRFYDDKYHVFLNKYWWLPTVFLALVLLALGGMPALIWGIFVRITVGLHFTWMVNSVCHMYGKRAFETKDDSRNNALVAAVTFGEGWHNNHHGDPSRARHGIEWWQIDLTWYFILFLKKIGLGFDLKS